MQAHEYGYRESPGTVDSLRAFGWKCDHCEVTHVCIYMRFDPTARILESVPDAEPIVSVISLTEKAARSLLSQLSYEVDNPAPGFDGGFQMAEFEL